MHKMLITGIDIDVHCIRAAVIRTHKGKRTLVDLQQVQSTQALFSNNYKLNYQETVNKLQELKSKLSILSQKVAMVIPETAVICKELSVESDLSALEEEPMIHHYFSLESHFATEELSIDYVKDTEKKSIKSSGTRYYVYATHKQEVETRRNASLEAGFHLAFVGSEKQMRLMMFIQLSKRMLSELILIDIGYRTTTLVVSKNQVPIEKYLMFGLKDLEQHGEKLFIKKIVDNLDLQLQGSPSLDCHDFKKNILCIGDIDLEIELDKKIVKKFKDNGFSMEVGRLRDSSDNFYFREGRGFERAIAIANKAINWTEAVHAA